MCHVLNTAVQTALSDTSIAKAIEPVKALSAHFRKSATAWEEFRRLQKRHLVHSGASSGSSDERSDSDTDNEDSGEDVGYLSDDDIVSSESEAGPARVLRLNAFCKTRWNSTYFLLKRALLLRASIRVYLTNNNDASLTVSDSAWQTIREVVDALAPIKDVSERLEGDTYVTISDALYFLLKMLYDRLQLSSTAAAQYPDKCLFLIAFKRKLLEQLDDVNIVYSWGLAAFLDGRRSHLQWARRIWENARDWPNTIDHYPSLTAFKNNLVAETGAMVSSLYPYRAFFLSCLH